MRDHLRLLLSNREFARSLADHGLRTILKRHTCAHRVSELLDIYAELRGSAREVVAVMSDE
jgi:spore maturation protein CgeB